LKARIKRHFFLGDSGGRSVMGESKMLCKWFGVCPLRVWEKERKIPDKWRKGYCETEENWKNCKRFRMEEQGRPHDEILPNGESIK
jgi:hypothetical protein